MSTNKQALREAAEKATHGEWLLEYGEDGFDGDDALIQCEVQGRIPVARIEGAHPESGFDADFQQEQQANAEFIAAASPATVLALLDELEAKDKRIAELSDSHSKLRETMAAIHNTIKQDGFATPLAVIMQNAKRAHEESADAAGITVKGGSE